MNYPMRVFIFIILINTFVLSYKVTKNEDENCKAITEKSPILRLKKYLFCEYDENVQTIPDDNETSVRVALELVPVLANFNEDSGNLEILGWMAAEWVDPHLKWEATSFDNITSFRVYSEKVWVPEIAVLSAGNEDSNVYGISTAACYLRMNGVVLCAPRLRHTIRCQTDFTDWPFDRQNCTLVLTLWSQAEENMSFLERANETMTLALLEQDGEWRIIVSRVFYDNRKSHFYENSMSSRLSIDIILDRVYNNLSGRFISPVILMMIMTLTTLWLNPTSTERLAVACLNPVIHLLAMQDLNWALPHNGSTVPGLLLFYANSLVLATIALILTFIFGNLQESKIPPPRWITMTTSRMLRSKIGQTLLLSMLDPKAAAEIEPDANDAGDLVCSETKKPTWNYFVIFFGWIFFITFLFIYAILYGILIPNSSMRLPITETLYSEWHY